MLDAICCGTCRERRDCNILDHELLCRIAPIVANRRRPRGKALLAAAPKMKLPSEILERTKTGFGIPVRSWAREATADSTRGTDLDSDDRLWSRTWARRVMAVHLMNHEFIKRAPDPLPHSILR